MQRPDRKQALVFLLHFSMLFAAFLLPWPWLADAYTSAFDVSANCVLAPIDRLSPVHMSFELPDGIAMHGSWKGKLRLADTRTGQVAQANLDIRGFSYRPLATYIALALAAPLRGRRKTAVVLGGGALLMISIGMIFSSLPILARFSAGGTFGVGPGLAVRTLYEAMATPVMVYAVPLIVFWALADNHRG